MTILKQTFKAYAQNIENAQESVCEKANPLTRFGIAIRDTGYCQNGTKQVVKN